ncbi:hypothetical protein TCAL_11255 [Tigriopus californicus]|uniref:Probable ATP-dependent RNA helicase DDX46 n=1 Tax=Tigriopus californicus TaxID=6832 RepID=A0A553NBF0_TIGCA|nr:hypothetical protein TCAL_11255 [Tigriopus californicus]|eukprot:TCALIF_11255-PA protein Name:"Similar to ddx46 Probable ATP-dependent RNA helicase DDX46 (Danio rerio)" AED:0.00 eAED:0.00 QI:0/-1/0/1/-1/1/1/0/1037
MGKDRRHRRTPSPSPERDRRDRHRDRAVHRRRSRSRDRAPHRRRSRSRERDNARRERDRPHRERRSRSKSRERKKRSRSREPAESKIGLMEPRKLKKIEPVLEANPESEGPKHEEEDEGAFDASSLDKDKELTRLELETKKRRERIEKWRSEKKKMEMENIRKEFMAGRSAPTMPVITTHNKEETTPKSMGKWSLEDDNDDEEPDALNKGQTEDDEDPLEAYMNTIQKEVKKLRGGGGLAAKGQVFDKSMNGAPGEKKKGMVIMMGVAKKKDDAPKKPKRGELIEQNQDGLEYSSEEEGEKLEDAMTKLANKGKKDMIRIDHNKIEYIDFQKDFYREVPELAKMTDEEVEAYRLELEGVKVKGRNVPKPIKNWPQCGVSGKVLAVLKKLNYDKPTPIQAQAIPICMSGRDMIGIAKTGSGKTLAFLLPMFRHIAAQPELEEGDGPIAIVMTPTRELCMQIGQEVRKFQRGLKGIRSVCVYGGTGISEQIAELKRGAEIIICTPGRMIDMLAANSGRVTNTRRITFIVLDEADRMFDMGFEPQVMRIIDNCRPDKQMVMFSATFPRQMEALARRILSKPIELAVGGKSVVCKDIDQIIHIVEDEQKFLKLLEVLGQSMDKGLAIVFVDKQEHADSLLKDLMNASYTSCSSLHGGIDQYDRESTITDFKSGKIKILVTTSVCARGLDVKELVLVVNYDCPNHYEDYVHRCGRTGRAGNHGYAHTFLTPEQGRYAGEIIKALELSEALVPQDLRALWNSYKAKQTEEGKTLKSGGGFGGSGFKFDESEATYTTEKKKFQKTVFGLQDSDDEDVEEEIDQQIELMLDPKRSVKTVSAAEAASSGLVPGTNVPSGTNPTGSSSAADKLELAKRLASKINIKNNPKGASQQMAESYLSGKQGQPLITAKTVADHLAAKLNAKLNYQPLEDAAEQEEEKGFQKFEEELIINDFPQQARWKVTSKEALAQISEYSDAGITVRGTYYPPGKSVPEGERKLFLAIESTNELSVQKAKVEITRLLKEELMKLQTSGIQHINKGRYKVL